MRAALIAEGSSDRGLTYVLERLCRSLGVSEIEVESTTDLLQRYGLGSTVEAKISTLLNADPEFDLLFVHRDADNAGLEARQQEIETAAARAGRPWPLVRVIPIKEMEAWLLLDEAQLRTVVGNPKGKAPLSLPKRSHVEACRDPKARLRAALQAATITKPGKKPSVLSSAQFNRYRARLLEELDIAGPVKELHAWQTLVAELRVTLIEVRLCTPED